MYSESQKKKIGVCANEPFDKYLYNIFHSIFKIFKITKLALKYRLFHQMCFCHSRDMFD